MTRQDYDEKVSRAALRDIWKSTKRLTRIIWSEKKGLAIALVFILAVLSAAPFLRSGSLGFLINELVRSADLGSLTSTFWQAFIFLGLAYAILPFFNSFQFYLLKSFWFFLEEKFEILVLKKKGEMDIAVHENPKFNDLFNKIRENGVWRIQNFSDRQFFIFQNVLELIIASVVLVFAGPLLLLVIFFGTLPELVKEVKYGKDVWGIWGAKAEVRRRFWDLRRHFEITSGVTELKLFQNVAYFISLIRGIIRTFHDEQRRAEKKKLIFEMVSLVLSQTAVIGVIAWLVFEVVKGNIQVGTLTFFVASIGSFRQALSGLFANLGRQYQDGLFLRDVFQLLDIKPIVIKPKKAVILDKRKTPDIIFENVTFIYPGAKKPALKNFSLEIPAGEKLALVGINGAGKTTLVKLLARFYDPTQGRIRVGGYDLRELDLESWYDKLGILFQDYNNYYFIVKEAIALGKTRAISAMKKIREAAESSEASAFIEEWEKTYQQMLGKHFTGGVEPSIGQWQKLALARTFYRYPRVLIMDEPTSSIDAEAEAKIFEKLETLPRNRTVILISHRFSTVRQANRIVVMKNGQLKELGTHDELLKLNGIYARLFRLQAKGYR